MVGIEMEAALRALGDPHALIDRVVGEALTLIPSAQGSVVEFAEGELLRYECAAGTFAPHVGLRRQASGSLSGLSIRLGSTLRCDDSEMDPRVDRDGRGLTAARSVVCVPLKCGHSCIGVLTVSSSRPFAFSDRDVATVAGLASFIGAVVTAVTQLDEVAGEWHSLPVEGVLRDQSFHIVHQAIVGLRTGEVVASEALSRFTSSPSRTPENWFRDAWRVGLGPDLELATAAAALQDLDRLPGHCRLAINVSAALIERPELASMLETVDPARIVLEVTELVEAEDIGRTRRALEGLRRHGVQVAMDDAGSGFSGLSRMTELSPDIIKLDRTLIDGIDVDPVRRSLATALVAFATDLGATVVAEGVESENQLEVVYGLGIELAQGYLIGRPVPVDQLDRPVRPVTGTGSARAAALRPRQINRAPRPHPPVVELPDPSSTPTAPARSGSRALVPAAAHPVVFGRQDGIRQ